MKFTVLQWNVWYEEPIQNIAAFLREHPADIVCLQELTFGHPKQPVADTPAFIAEGLGFNYFLKEIPIELPDGGGIPLANAVFSRFPISNERAVFINEPRRGGGYDDEYRAYVEVTLDIAGVSVTVGTVHLSYNDGHVQTPNKQAETDRLLKELKSHPSRYVITGDFNAPSGSYTINKVTEILQNAGPDLTQKTWTTKPFEYRGFKSDKLNWRLDHIFATPDLKVISTQILPTNYSDHLPLLTTFEMEELNKQNQK